jgi:hypothetical protein
VHCRTRLGPRYRLSRAGTSYDYGYKNRDRLATMTVGGNPASLYDRAGNLLAETDGSGASGTIREYIWLRDTEIAPTSGSRTALDRPIAVVSDVSTSPARSSRRREQDAEQS